MYDYWNLFFYFYSIKIIEKFKKNEKKNSLLLIDLISISELFKDNNNGFNKIKESENIKVGLNRNMTSNTLTNKYSLNLLFQNKKSLNLQQKNELFPNKYMESSRIIINQENNLLLTLSHNNDNSITNLNNKALFTEQNTTPYNYENKNLSYYLIIIEYLIIIKTKIMQIFYIQQNLQNKKSSIYSNNNILPNEFMIGNNNTTNLEICGKNEYMNNVDNKNKEFNNKTINSNLEHEKSNNLNNQDNNFKITFNCKDKSQFSKKNNTNKNNFESNNQIVKQKIFSINKLNNSKNKRKNELKPFSTLISKKRKRYTKSQNSSFSPIDKKNDKEYKEKKCSEEKEKFKVKKAINFRIFTELIKKNTNYRGSRYRGVSKNGKQWQVLIMIKKKKKYLGSFSSEEDAARVYDTFALLYQGNKAKTNYNYTKEEIEKIKAEYKN